MPCLLWNEKDHTVTERSPSCVKSKWVFKVHRFTSFSCSGWSVLEQTNETPTIFQRRCSKVDPATLTSRWRTANEHKIPPLGDQYGEKKGNRC